MLTCDRLTQLRRSRTILHGISFSPRPGRVTGFLGTNGAGKSSKLRIPLGLDRATSGTALVDGQPFTSMRDPLRKVGALLDSSGAHRSRTGRVHLRWVTRSAGIALRGATTGWLRCAIWSLLTDQS